MQIVQAKANQPFVPSIDRTTLVKVFLAIPVGETAKYETFSDAIGRNILGCRWLLDGARDECREKHGAVYEALRGIGMRRLPHEEVPARGTKRIKKARRSALEAVKDTRCADYNSLSPSARAEFNMTLSISGTMIHLTRPSRVKKMQEVWTDKFDPRETMRLFLKK